MGIGVYSQHHKDLQTPLILVSSSRSSGAQGSITNDYRFMRSVRVAISAILIAPNSDKTGFQMLEACRHIMHQAWWDQTVVPNVGVIAKINNAAEPSRVSDFQSASNIVQYPSLPKEAVRFEQAFNILLRPDSSHDNPFFK